MHARWHATASVWSCDGSNSPTQQWTSNGLYIRSTQCTDNSLPYNGMDKLSLYIIRLAIKYRPHPTITHSI